MIIKITAALNNDLYAVLKIIAVAMFLHSCNHVIKIQALGSPPTLTSARVLQLLSPYCPPTSASHPSATVQSQTCQLTFTVSVSTAGYDTRPSS